MTIDASSQQSSDTRISVAPQSDFLLQQARAAPLQALAECIWNSLDADADSVEIEFVRDELSLRKIVVRDNGTGITRINATDLFRKLGDSWKKRTGRSAAGRALHGSEGRGRYKVTALGNVADWHVVYDAGDGQFRAYTISLLSSDPASVLLTAETSSNAKNPGVELVISEPLADFRSLQSDETPQELAEIFATYLRSYSNISLSLQGVKVDPSAVVASAVESDLSDIIDGGQVYSAKLEIVEWHRPTKRVLYLCDERGFPMLNVDTRWHVGEHFFSAYLRSSLIREMSDRNEIGIGEMNPNLAQAVEEARQTIKGHFRKRAAQDAQSVVNDWKYQQIYPYPEPPSNPIEEVEREVFDIVAVTASRYIPDFTSTASKAKAFNLRMMRTAIESGSDDLQLILNEVLKLPQRKQEELAALLQETSLLSIIGASKIVADRLRFLTALESLIFDNPISSVLRERTQLHRILAENSWIFGEEFQMMVDDQSLTECLVQHQGAKPGRRLAAGAVKHPTKTRGIVDLMFGRQRRLHRASDLEHLVVELKAPNVQIAEAQVQQIEGYVQAIVNDARFDKATTRWTFWALSKEIDKNYIAFRQVEGRPEGVVLSRSNITVWVKTWAQVISENRARMQFFQESLRHNVSKADALAYLKRSHDKVFADTPAGVAIDNVCSSSEVQI